jgi:hypothetical protein
LRLFLDGHDSIFIETVKQTQNLVTKSAAPRGPLSSSQHNRGAIDFCQNNVHCSQSKFDVPGEYVAVIAVDQHTDDRNIDDICVGNIEEESERDDIQ